MFAGVEIALHVSFGGRDPGGESYGAILVIHLRAIERQGLPSDDRRFSAGRDERPNATIGWAVLIGDADNQALLAGQGHHGQRTTLPGWLVVLDPPKGVVL